MGGNLMSCCRALDERCNEDECYCGAILKREEAALSRVVVEAAMRCSKIGTWGADTITDLDDACAALAAFREKGK